MGESDVTSGGGQAPADPLIGRTLDGRYLIKRVIGRGGMGVVYEAQHLGLDRRVALKFLLDTDGDPDAVARFRREARAASRIDHENVVDIFDVGTDQQIDFIAMEYVEGEDLRTILARGALPPARAVEIARQMLEGLDAIHAAGIVHRDIKPGNVVVTAVTGREIVKIMDFGISKTHEPGLTAVGKVVGTPEYMAPEQRAGDATDHRADLYAVGLTLYAMLTGSSPTDAATVAMSPSGKRPKVPPALAGVVERALASSRDDRYASAREFSAALVDASVSGGADVAAPPTEATRADRPASRDVQRESRSRWPIAALAAVVVGALVGVGIWQMTKNGAPAKAEIVRVPTAVTTVPIDAAAAQDPAESARAAEREGKLDLAIARYVEANEATHDPELLFRIGELYERLDRTTEAVRYYERYRDEGPASGRAAALAKIARLQPAAAAIDAGVRPVAAGHKPAAAATLCHCISDAPGTKGNYLCAKKYPALCQCEYERRVVCPSRYELCASGKCPDDLLLVTSYNGTAWGCRDLELFTRYVTATTGAACKGYADSDLGVDGSAADRASERDAAYACNYCSPSAALIHDDAASGFRWSGKTGEPCKGVLWSTGATVAGHLECKAP